ncbi:MAG: protein translocase subunit SecD [Holosporales bacterium]|jgi:preprotein translocase subunit SecD|nr:protein translocase subunit SecD [Holosporales bacterium]
MLVVSRFKYAYTIAVCMLGTLFAIPSFVSQETFDKLPGFLQHTVSLGLELRGGSHIQLEVDLRSVEKERQESIVDETRKLLRKQNIKYSKISVQSRGDGSAIFINLKNQDDVPSVQKMLLKIEKQLEVSVSGAQITAVISEAFMDEFAKRVVSESIEVIRHRIDETGTTEPTILRQGRDRIVVQRPGAGDSAEVKKVLGKTAMLTFHAVDEDMESIEAVNPEQKPNLPAKPGVVYLPEDRGNKTMYVPVKKQHSLTGKSVVDAQVTIDNRTGMPAVSIKFDSIDGARKMAELSTKYLGKQFAMVLDGKVLSAPVFQSVLNDGNAQITGNFTMEEATQLALLLRAGSLPAPLNVVEERSVGPSLGADSIVSGKNATICAFIFVALFMLASYGKFGGFAVVSLTANIMLLFACLTLLGATLTLPGIAGIALSIGMAVDANVLIYERIREEIRSGIRAIIAVAQGYRMAMTTIVDSNLTTMVGAIVLYEFGSGPIRGFAVTLALGALISMFTTFSLTKLLIHVWTRRNGNKGFTI